MLSYISEDSLVAEITYLTNGCLGLSYDVGIGIEETICNITEVKVYETKGYVSKLMFEVFKLKFSL